MLSAVHVPPPCGTYITAARTSYIRVQLHYALFFATSCLQGLCILWYILTQVFQQVEGACYDLDYAREAVTCMSTVSNFKQVSQLLDSAIQLKKEVDNRKSSVVQPVTHSSINSISVEQATPPIPSEPLLITPKSFDWLIHIIIIGGRAGPANLS